MRGKDTNEGKRWCNLRDFGGVSEAGDGDTNIILANPDGITMTSSHHSDVGNTVFRPKLLNKSMYQLPGEAKSKCGVTRRRLVKSCTISAVCDFRLKILLYWCGCQASQTITGTTLAAELQRQGDARVIHELRPEMKQSRVLRRLAGPLPATDPCEAGHHDLCSAPYLLNRFVRPHSTTGSGDGVSQSRGCREDGLRLKRCRRCGEPPRFSRGRFPINGDRVTRGNKFTSGNGEDLHIV